MVETIKEHIKYTILQLRLSGLYVDSDDFFGSSRYYLIYSCFINVGVIGIFNLSQIMYVLVNIEDTTLLLTHAYLILTYVMPTIKACFYLKNWPRIRRLVAQLKDEGFQPKNRRQAEIFEGPFKILRLAHACFLVMLPLASIFWALIPLLGKKKRSLPYPCWTPFDYQRPVVFEIVYVHQCVGVTCMMGVNMALDMLLFGFALYIASECELLSDILSHIHQVTEERLENRGLLPMGLYEAERTRRITDGAEDTLMSCIDLHWKILRIAQEVNEVFTVLAFVQLGSSLLSLCLIMYGFKLITSVAEMVVAGVFICGLFSELLFLCFFGHAIITNSSEIGFALYSTPWMDCSRDFRRNMLFFMLRVQKPIKMLALDFFEMALPTFVWILRGSWSFYTVLRQTTHE